MLEVATMSGEDAEMPTPTFGEKESREAKNAEKESGIEFQMIQ